MSLDPNHDPASPLGWDVDVETDMQSDGRACSGERLVANAVLHRLKEDNLPLIGSPEGFVAYGVDVRRWVGEVTTQERAQEKAPLLALVIARDTRIDSGSIDIALVVGRGAALSDGSLVELTITIDARTTTARPIALVLGVSRTSVEMLAQGT